METEKFFDILRERTRSYRAELNLTQKQLGEIIGANEKTITNFERGKTLLREDALDSLIRLMGRREFLLAVELRGLASWLLSTDVPREAKIHGFFARIHEYVDAEESIRGKLDEVTKD